LTSSKEISFQAQLLHQKKGLSKWKVKFHPICNDKVSCVFSRETKDEEVFSYWKALDEYSDMAAVWLELDDDLNDVLFLHISQKNRELYGKSYDEVVGHYAIKEVGFAIEELIVKIPMFKLAEKKKIAEVCTEVNFPAGKLWGIYKFVFLGYNNGNKKKSRFLVIISDATEIKRMEKDLEEKEKVINHLEVEVSLFEKFFMVSPVPMAVIDVIDDSIFRLVVSNKGYADILGKTPAQVNGKTSAELGSNPSIIAEFIQKLKQSKITNSVVQFDVISPRYGAFTCIGLHFGNNRYHYLCLNITEEKKINDGLMKHKEYLENLVKARTTELMEALQVKGRFLAIMSHEMRTPLTGLTGALHLLAETKLNEEQRELTNIAEVCGDQLLAVINDVLDLSKMEENKMNIEMETVDIVKLLEDSMDVVALEAERKGIELILHIHQDTHSHLVGDMVRIRQILVNLLTNAVKFTGNLFMGEN